jgi:hypothetical protein
MDSFLKKLSIGCCGFYVKIPFNCLDIVLCAIVSIELSGSAGDLKLATVIPSEKWPEIGVMFGAD